MKHIFHWLLIGVTLLGLIIRLDGMDEDGLYHDEAVCWRDVNASWPNFITTLLEGECNPPLYFALLKIWTGLVGESVLALRLPSVVFGTLTIPLLGWLVARLAGPGAACLAALFLAISPFHVYYSQEARPYAFFPFMVLASTTALVWALETRNMAGWAKGGKWLRSPFVLFALYGLLTLAAVSLDYSYAIDPLRALAATAVLFWALEKWKGKRSGQLEIYAVLAVVAFYTRYFYYAYPLTVLVVAMACLWVVETALDAWRGGRHAWRSRAYAVLAFFAFLSSEMAAETMRSQYLTVVLPFFVLGLTAVLYWALEIRKGAKREGGEEIYAFVVVIAFFVLFHGTGASSATLAASAPVCWALEKWQRSRRKAGENESKPETQSASDVSRAARTVADPLPLAASGPVSPSPLVRFCVYAFLALLACYTHYFAAFFMAGHGAFVALVCWRERRLRPAWSWILCMVAVGICYVPWLPYMLQFNLVRPTQWVSWLLRDWSAAMQFWFDVKTLIFGNGYPLWRGNAFPDAVLVLVPLVVWLAYRTCFESGGSAQESGARSPRAGDVNHRAGADSSQTCGTSGAAAERRPQDAYAFALFTVMTMVPLLAAWAFSQYRPSLVPRYIIPCVPTLMALLALAIWRLRWLGLRIALAAVTRFYLFGEMHYQQSAPSRPKLNLAAAYIGAHLEPGDCIVVEPAEVYVVVSYYLRERTPPQVNEYHPSDHPDSEERPLPKNLAEKLAPYKRVWLLREGTAPPFPIERYLDAHFEQAAPQQKFDAIGAVKVYVLRHE